MRIYLAGENGKKKIIPVIAGGGRIFMPIFKN